MPQCIAESIIVDTISTPVIIFAKTLEQEMGDLLVVQ